ncbi:MAG: PIN domain-containing protein, partial [Candidatus Dormibacteraeota bacterium]|nr:PIN domain-containing protein [Candidatus Dormibacteraeota bacterium]
AIRQALEADPGPLLVPAGILAEITYLVGNRLGARVLDAFLLDLEAGAFSLECGELDFSRIRDLVSRYRDMPLGAADASVVACAERNGGRVLTLDRHFGIVAREGRIEVLPA